jgi:hypothetical protein
MNARILSVALDSVSAVLLAFSLVADAAENPSATRAAAAKNGFDLSDALVPVDEIMAGGPPRDSIPALDAPRFISPGDENLPRSHDRVLGLSLNGITKAYPIAILNWHEIVNDEFSGEPVVVTYCPLCGSGMAYRAEVGGSPLSFGVSGLLYNSDVLFYDRQTQSLWSQLGVQAISGPFKGQQLEPLPLNHTTWGEWWARHPETWVLSAKTGFDRDYSRDPYADYARSSRPMFRVTRESGLFQPKELILGVELDGQAKAYAFSELAKTPGDIMDTVARESLTVHFDSAHHTGLVYRANGTELPSVIAYWFAWHAFHPDTAVFRAGQ